MLRLSSTLGTKVSEASKDSLKSEAIAKDAAETSDKPATEVAAITARKNPAASLGLGWESSRRSQGGVENPTIGAKVDDLEGG